MRLDLKELTALIGPTKACTHWRSFSRPFLPNWLSFVLKRTLRTEFSAHSSPRSVLRARVLGGGYHWVPIIESAGQHGFQRLHAARTLKGQGELVARFLETDEQGAKAAIFNLNRITGRPVELEEAWIIYALVIDDGLEQIEVAHMLGRHKSWVNRRLALIERLCAEARESLRLGLINPTQARHLTRLPRGNQNSAMLAATHAALTSRELSGMVDLLLL